MNSIIEYMMEIQFLNLLLKKNLLSKIEINGKIDRKSGNKIIGKLRVGAYCRVSTDNKDQLNSYASQLSYYK